jgi:acyl-CoA reductase-like NAD-dependent aldehyde dehydrogenase
MDCGYVWINCFLVRDLRMPFGGCKDSGTGREGYPYSISDFFTHRSRNVVERVQNYLDSDEWDLKSLLVERNVIKFSCCPEP